MSPTSTTGTPAARAKPKLAMSPARRLTSAALPAPSTSTRSAPAASSSKAASTSGSNCARSAQYWRAERLARRRPRTTTCEPVSPSGLSSTGFMAVSGARRAARACSAWARPISPPSAVTAALLLMFCGLKGAAERPRLAKARQSPATISDLPTSEPVPMNIRDLVIAVLCTGDDVGVRAHDAADDGAHGQLADALGVERLEQGRQAGLLSRGIVEFVAV